MWRTFSQARFVYIWLGTEIESTRLAFYVMNAASYIIRIESEIQRGFWPEDVDPKEGFHGIYEISCNPYWSRIWVVQEILWARLPVLMCGKYTAPLGGLLKHQPHITQQCEDLLLQCNYRRNIVDYGEGKHQIRYKEMRRALFINTTRQCADPRDKIFATLSLPDALALQHRLRPDYTMTVEEVAASALWWLSNNEEASFGKQSDDYIRAMVFRLLDMFSGVTEYQSWLQARAYWNDRQNAWFLPVGSLGAEVDCSGMSLHHLLNHSREARACKDLHRKNCDRRSCPMCEVEGPRPDLKGSRKGSFHYTGSRGKLEWRGDALLAATGVWDDIILPPSKAKEQLRLYGVDGAAMRATLEDRFCKYRRAISRSRQRWQLNKILYHEEVSSEGDQGE